MSRLLALLIATILFCVTAVAGDQPDLELKNARQVSDVLTTGGQPSKADLQRLKDAGFTTVINLRREGEVTKADDPDDAANYNFDEAALASSLGLKYFHLPISSGEGLTEENAKMLDDLLNAAQGPVLLHCGSGNRAGAMMALRAFHVQGKSAQDALEIGKAAGLTGLEPKVREILALDKTEAATIDN